MVTEQLMLRDNGFIQRISDGYFNATKLVDFWNNNNLEKKQLAQYKLLRSTDEYIQQLIKEGIEKPMIAGRGKGELSGTWMHPKLFIDLAMWVSVEFKSKVIDYVIDGLINSRHNSGDYYNEMTAALVDNHVRNVGTSPKFYHFINEANSIKMIAGVEKERNELTEKELDLITLLQKANTTMLNNDWGKQRRFDQLKFIAESFNLEIKPRKP